jgi:hypothetical protein
MANRLNNDQIAALLARNVSTLKPGDLEDLRAVLDCRHATRTGGAGSDPDSARSAEDTLNAVLLPPAPSGGISLSFDAASYPTSAGVVLATATFPNLVTVDGFPGVFLAFVRSGDGSYNRTAMNISGDGTDTLMFEYDTGSDSPGPVTLGSVATRTSHAFAQNSGDPWNVTLSSKTTGAASLFRMSVRRRVDPTVDAQASWSLLFLHNQTLDVSVAGNSIEALLATDSSGTLTTTWDVLLTALQTNSDVTNLTDISVVGTPAGTIQETFQFIARADSVQYVGLDGVVFLTTDPDVPNLVLNFVGGTGISTAGVILGVDASDLIFDTSYGTLTDSVTLLSLDGTLVGDVSVVGDLPVLT